MKLVFSGHEYRYAVEQMLSTLFPGECPDYTPYAAGEDGMTVRLSTGKTFTTATCAYASRGETFHGRAAVKTALMTDANEIDRLSQFIIKNAVYRAVRSSGMTQPPWGSLTGVRPGKLMHGIMKRTGSRAEAVAAFSAEYDVTPARANLCYETSLFTDRCERLLTESDVCLYVGIPFCPTRCAYCSFVSQSVEKNMKLMAPFLSALETELAAVAEQVKRAGLRVVSIYAGGGTPTTLSPAQADRLASFIESHFDLSGLREYTVEAGRPDTITAEKLAVLRSHGVTRVSVNPQTMCDAVLERIGRRHTAQDVMKALEAVRSVGGFDVNMDLIAGLPGDCLSGFEATLETVLSLAPENITVHTLSMKKGSSLIGSGADLPSAAEVGAMLDRAYAALGAKNYLPYYLYRQKNMSGGFENTGWTQPGHDNLYNICMMEELCGILAVGGGGSTKLIRQDGGKNIRLTAPKYPLEYIEQIDKICKDKERIGEFYGL